MSKVSASTGAPLNRLMRSLPLSHNYRRYIKRQAARLRSGPSRVLSRDPHRARDGLVDPAERARDVAGDRAMSTEAAPVVDGDEDLPASVKASA